MIDILQFWSLNGDLHRSYPGAQKGVGCPKVDLEGRISHFKSTLVDKKRTSDTS